MLHSHVVARYDREPLAEQPGGSAPLYVLAVRGAAGLAEHQAAWEDLAANALEPNPFYEPFALLPALRYLAAGVDVEVLLIYAPPPALGRPPRLCGLVPIAWSDRWKGLPLVTARCWRHKYCFLGTPLIRAGVASPTIDTLLDWLRGSPAALMEWPAIGADGPFHAALAEALDARGLGHLRDSSSRALFRRAESAETFLAQSLTRKKRKELRRLETRLFERASCSYDALAADGDLDRWLDEFLLLEVRGWKGRRGSAIATRPAERALFVRMATAAHRERRWIMYALRAAGRPIAMKCDLVAPAGGGGFAFKIAYDEDYARYSPGVLLEIEHIRRLHSRDDVAWMDSCAIHNHPMINHLWREQRRIDTLTVDTGRTQGGLVLALVPLGRWARGLVRGGRGEGQ